MLRNARSWHGAATSDSTLKDGRPQRFSANVKTADLSDGFIISITYLKTDIMNLTDIAGPFTIVPMQNDTAIVASVSPGVVSIHISILVVVILRLMAG